MANGNERNSPVRAVLPMILLSGTSIPPVGFFQASNRLVHESFCVNSLSNYSQGEAPEPMMEAFLTGTRNPSIKNDVVGLHGALSGEKDL